MLFETPSPFLFIQLQQNMGLNACAALESTVNAVCENSLQFTVAPVALIDNSSIG